MKERLYPSHIAILVFMIQNGIVALELTRMAAVYYGTNGWLSVIIFAAVSTFNIFLISLVYKLGEGESIFSIMKRFVPRYVLIPFYLFIALFLSMIGSLVGKEYVYIFQMIAFPTASTFLFQATFDVLVFLLLIKGIYNISKATTIFFILLIWMVWMIFLFAEDFELSRLTPFLFKGGIDTISGSFKMYAAFMGYELVMFMFPYVDNTKKWFKSVYFGNFMTSVHYLFMLFISFGYYSLDQMKIILFPMLDLLAYIRFPFVDRLENLLFSFLLFTALVTSVMYMWSALESVKNAFPKADSNLLALLIVLITFLVSIVPDTFFEMETWLIGLTYTEIAFSFGLPTILILLLLIQKWKGGERVAKNAG